MNFSFTSEQELFRKKVRDFFQSKRIQEELRSIQVMDGDIDPRSLYRLIAKEELLAVNWPVEYGGAGMSMVEAGIVEEEMSYCGIPDSLYMLSNQMVGMFLLLAGSEEQKRRFLPKMASGELYAGILYTEPEAGSDLSQITTSATKCDDGSYIINGKKVFNWKSNLVDFALCIAKTGGESKSYFGLTIFVVPMRSESVQVTKINNILDERFNEVVLTNHKVSSEDIVGKIGTGLSLITKALAFERTGLDYYVKAKRWFELYVQCKLKSTDSWQDSEYIKVAKLGSKLDSSKFLTYKMLNQIDQKQVNDALAAVSKWYSSELDCEVSWHALESLGVEACMKPMNNSMSEYYQSLEPAYRESPALTLSAGTSEMMLKTMSRAVAKLKRKA